MALETTREKIIYGALVPLSASVLTALATVVFTGDACQLAPGTDFLTILQNQRLSGPEKMKALELYTSVTDRPWSVVRSLTSMTTILVGAWVAMWAFNTQRR